MNINKFESWIKGEEEAQDMMFKGFNGIDGLASEILFVNSRVQLNSFEG